MMVLCGKLRSSFSSIKSNYLMVLFDIFTTMIVIFTVVTTMVAIFIFRHYFSLGHNNKAKVT